jgi:hypothetical protein
MAALAALAAGPCRAQHQPVENGMPCVSQLCVGENLQDLLQLPWDDVNTVPPQPDTIEEGLIYADPATMQTVAAYWPKRTFDAAGLLALTQVDAVCQDLGVWQRPRASFTDSDGHRTAVSFEPVVSEDGHVNHFEVATITRWVDHDATPEDIRALGEDIAKRYAGLPPYPSSVSPGVLWRPTAAAGASLELFAPVGDPAQRAIDLNRHPMCHGE